MERTMAKPRGDGPDHDPAREAEEALEHQAAEEHEGDGAGAGDLQHAARGGTAPPDSDRLLARGAHVVAADLPRGTSRRPAALAAQARQQRQDDGQHQEFHRVQPGAAAEIGTSRSTRARTGTGSTMMVEQAEIDISACAQHHAPEVDARAQRKNTSSSAKATLAITAGRKRQRQPQVDAHARLDLVADVDGVAGRRSGRSSARTATPSAQTMVLVSFAPPQRSSTAVCRSRVRPSTCRSAPA